MHVTGVIQAGGKSARMGGVVKALLDLGDRRIIERVLDVVARVTDDQLIVTNTPDLYAYLGLPMVGDRFPDHGSLGGIYTGVHDMPGDVAFTVACDMPFLSADVARLLIERAEGADVVIPRINDQVEPLHACYARACLGPMERRLRAGRLKIAGFFPDVRVVEVSELDIARVADPARVFLNVNTPEELARARALASETG